MNIPDILGWDFWWRWQAYIVGAGVLLGAAVVLWLVEKFWRKGVEVGIGAVVGVFVGMWLSVWKTRHERPEAK